MKNKFFITLCTALVISFVSQNISIPANQILSMFIPTLGIEREESSVDEKLLVLDADSLGVEYCFKFAEIIRKLFK